MGNPSTAATPDSASSILPVEMESGNKKPQEPPTHKQRQRHRCRRACFMASCCLLLTLLILVLVAVILFLTLLKPKNPTTTLQSVTVEGLATDINLATFQPKLNITVHIQIAVRNPNRASFDAGNGATEITYRGTLVGTADIEPAVIPQRGTGAVSCHATVLADAFGTHLGELLQDALKGSIQLETSSRIPGRVKILGFIKKHAVATAQCTIEIGFPDLQVKSQQCSQKTKL